MKQRKYYNTKVKIDGIAFDSKKEGQKYYELKMLQRAKKISKLELQPKYILQESFKSNGQTHRAITYSADFRYIQDGKEFIIDVKGFKTDIYRLKKKLLLFKYPNINFIEC